VSAPSARRARSRQLARSPGADRAREPAAARAANRARPRDPTVAWRPTPTEIAAAVGSRVPDVLAPDLRILFCGINPGLYSGAVGHHFARPGNRFWKALHESGLTPRVLSPFAERELLALGIGVTNLVDRATATADQLSADELARGGRRLEAKVLRHAPAFVAFLGIGAYRSAFGRSKAALGLQPEAIGETRIWLLPNPSGLNASYSLAALGEAFRALARAADRRKDFTRLSGAAARPRRGAKRGPRSAARGSRPAP
jgi:TDG/mug DNA glycosylase family protein